VCVCVDKNINTQAGHTVVFNDVDLVWLSPNILAYFDYTFNERQFAHMQDHFSDVNAGFYVARPTPQVKEIFAKIMQMMSANENLLDQEAFNAYLPSEEIKKFKFTNNNRQRIEILKCCVPIG
jgi:hypothetical protein